MGDYVKTYPLRQRSNSESGCSSQPHHLAGDLEWQKGYNLEKAFKSRTCYKILIIWSLLTTLISIISAYFALEVHNSVVLHHELRDLNQIMATSGGGPDLAGKRFRRARVWHRHGFYYNLARANKRSRNKGDRNRRINMSNDTSNTSGQHKDKDSTQILMSEKEKRFQELPGQSLESLKQANNTNADQPTTDGGLISKGSKHHKSRKNVKEILQDLIEVLDEENSEALVDSNNQIQQSGNF